MELSEIIRTWHRLALGDEVDRSDVFFRFVAIWVAFNALYSSMNSGETGDWDQVRSFAGEPEAVDRHRKLLREDEEYRQAIAVLKDRGVRGHSRGYVRRIERPENLHQVASCLYQVRCNLFHGGKAPGNQRDESLVGAAYTVVSKLIDPFVNYRLQNA